MYKEILNKPTYNNKNLSILNLNNVVILYAYLTFVFFVNIYVKLNYLIRFT